MAPRTGLGAASGAFVDDLINRASRYGSHLFVCFDDPRIPATANELEGFWGDSKHVLRNAVGCGSTTNTVVSNLGAEVLLAFHQTRQPGALADMANPTASIADFCEARAKIASLEAPGIRQRSMVRHVSRHLANLRQRWFGPAPPAGGNA